jgi:DNA-binding LacI/PurR family transcriptional regulator
MSVTEVNAEQLKNVKLDQTSDAPLHSQMRVALRALIEERFQPGDLFFSEKALVQSLPVSEITIRRALGDLCREGLLIRKRGIGTLVGQTKGPRPYDLPPKGVVPHSGVMKRTATLQKTVGIFRGDCYSEYISAMIEQLSAVCAKRDINVQVYHTNNGERVAKVFQQVTRTPDQEAIILCTGVNEVEILYHAFHGLGYRTVALDGASVDYPGAFVRTDAEAAVDIAMSYLLGLGHRRIAFLVNEPDYEPSVIEKVEKFQQIARAQELDGRSFVAFCNARPCAGSYEAAYVHMEDVWTADPAVRPTAIFTASDPGAWACLKWFAERGINVPGDVSVLGFEDAHSSRMMHPSLSTVAHPLGAIARRTIELLWNAERAAPCHELISPTLVVRESTGPPRAEAL